MTIQTNKLQTNKILTRKIKTLHPDVAFINCFRDYIFIKNYKIF